MDELKENFDNVHIKEDLFRDVKYFVTGNLDPRIEKLLENGGATASSFMFTTTTHLICGPNFDENEVAQAADLYEVPSVTQDWILASVHLGHLATTIPYDPMPNRLFSQISAAITNVNRDDRFRLYALLTYNGASVTRTFTGRTTHLICGTPSGTAYQHALTLKSDNFAIVTPDWVLNCLMGRELLDTQLYHPRLLIHDHPLGHNSQQPFKAIDLQDQLMDSSLPVTSHSLSSILGFEYDESLIMGKVDQLTANEIETSLDFGPITTSQTSDMIANRIPTVSSGGNIVQQSPIVSHNINQTVLQHSLQSAVQMGIQQRPITNPQSTNIPFGGPSFSSGNKIVQHRPIIQTTIASHEQQQLQQMSNMQNQQISQSDMGGPGQMIQAQPKNVNNMPSTTIQSHMISQQHHQQQTGQQQIIVQQMGQQGTGTVGGSQQVKQIQIIQQTLQGGQQTMHGTNSSQQILQQTRTITNPSAQLQSCPSGQSKPQIIQNTIINNPTSVQSQLVQQQQQQPTQLSQPPPAQRIIMTQQQFNQMSHQQQQQLLQNSQNQNIVIINQTVPTGGSGGPVTGQIVGGNGQSIGQQQLQQMTSSSQINQIPISGQQQIVAQQQQMQLQRNQNSQLQSVEFGQHSGNVLQTQPNQQTNQMTIQGQQSLQQQQQLQQQQLPQQQIGQHPTHQMNQQQRLQYLHNLQQQQQQQQTIHQIKMQLQQPMGMVSSKPQSIQQQSQQIISSSTIQGGSSGGGMIGSSNQIDQQIIQQAGQATIGQSNVDGVVQQQSEQQLQTIQQGQQIIQQTSGGPHSGKIHIQNQIIVQPPGGQATMGNVIQQTISPLASAAGVQSIASQSQWAGQQQMGQQSGGIMSGQQGQPTQFIRAARPQLQWQPGGNGGGQQSQQPQAAQGQQPQRQLIHLDAQTHAHLQSLDPARRAEYLAKIQAKRNLMLRQQIAFTNRPQVPAPQAGQSVPRVSGTQHIIVRSPMPPGLNQQQQMQWLQQQTVRPLLVRGTAPGLSPISQPTGQPEATVSGQSVPVPAQQQQQQLQLQLQRQQYQRMQQMQQTKLGQQAVSPRGGFGTDGPDSTIVSGSMPSNSADSNSAASQMNSKTKTALTNLLNTRLGNNGGQAIVTPDANVVGGAEPSAAGTLRLMTAQHNAALNHAANPRTPQELLALQQQRRTLGNITNSVGPQPVPGTQPVPVVGPSPVIGGPAAIKGPPFSPGRPHLQRPQFYGHNPNLKLPPELFLLGCNFYIVEYDDSHATELPEWKELIQKHGGEIESFYCPRVTHVLCRTQRHGVVMQAIRDSKRCVTAYWLNDTILKKQVVPPWQALHLPLPSTFGTQRPATKHIIAVTGFEGDERQRIKQMVKEAGAHMTTYLSRHNTVLVCKRPEGIKYHRAKDWSIPVVNTIWLSDILVGNLKGMSQYDSEKYQQFNLTGQFRVDYVLVAHLMTAWKSPINLTQESHERVKRGLAEPPISTDMIKAKKMRLQKPSEPIPEEIICKQIPLADQIPKILFSRVDNIDGLTRIVCTLGGQVVNDPAEATHVVLTHLARTCKLIAALCVVKHIVSSTWLIDCALQGYFLPTDDYTVNDDQFKETFGDIQHTVQVPNRDKLFAGRTFYMTPSVRPSVKILTKMIELAGGKVDRQRPSASRISELNQQSPASYIVLSCIDDLHLLIDLARPTKPNRIICATELVMTSIIHQDIQIDCHKIRYS